MAAHHRYEGNSRRREAASLIVGVALCVVAWLAATGQAFPKSHAAAAARARPVPPAGPVARRVVRRPAARPHVKAAARRRHVAVRHRRAPERVGAVERFARLGLPLVCGGPQRRVVALTFDDGPGPYTAQLLAILRAGGARATFFLVGDRIPDWPHIPAAEARLGAVGDHTWSHAFLPRLSAGAAAAEVVRGREAAERAIDADVRLFRPPYDGRTPTVERRIRARGMLDVLWSIDTSDYLPSRTPSRILRDLGARLRPGSIVLMHDIHPGTVSVVRRLLPMLRRRHLRPVAIPELLRVDPPSRRLLAAGGPGCWR